MKRQVTKARFRKRLRMGLICAVIAFGISGYSLEIENSVMETSAVEGSDKSIDRTNEESINAANFAAKVRITKNADLTLKAKSTKKTSKVTTGQKNALKKAKSYLSFSSFSKKGLIKQLEYEGFSNKEAAYAVSKCGANWNKQALSKAKSYLDVTSFSY